MFNYLLLLWQTTASFKIIIIWTQSQVEIYKPSIGVTDRRNGPTGELKIRHRSQSQFCDWERKQMEIDRQRLI